MKKKKKPQSTGPKLLTLETRLPYVFDLHWDAKTVKDLLTFRLQNNKDVRRHLAEAGYDVKSLDAIR